MHLSVYSDRCAKRYALAFPSSCSPTTMSDNDEPDCWDTPAGEASASSEWDHLLQVLDQAKPCLFDTTKLDELVAMLPSIERRTAPLLAEALHDSSWCTAILSCMSYDLTKPLENLAALGFLANLKVRPLPTTHAPVHPDSLLFHVHRKL